MASIKLWRQSTGILTIAIGKEAAIQEAGVVEVLSDVYSQWAQGGGAAKVDVNKDGRITAADKQKDRKTK